MQFRLTCLALLTPIGCDVVVVGGPPAPAHGKIDVASLPSGRFESTLGPAGGMVRALAADLGYIYAARHQVHRLDGGTWTAITTDLPGMEAEGLALLDGLPWVVKWDGIVRWNGSWQTVATGIDDPLVFVGATTQAVFAVAYTMQADHHLVRAEASGAVAVLTLPDADSSTRFAVTPGGALLKMTGQSIARSADGGDTWYDCVFPPGNIFFEYLGGNDTLLVGRNMYLMEFFFSYDDGATWVLGDLGDLQDDFVSVLYALGDGTWVAQANSSWLRASHPAGPWQAVAVEGSRSTPSLVAGASLFRGEVGGVVQVDFDGGATVTHSQGLSALQVDSALSVADGVVVSTHGGVFFTASAGDDWIPYQEGLPVWAAQSGMLHTCAGSAYLRSSYDFYRLGASGVWEPAQALNDVLTAYPVTLVDTGDVCLVATHQGALISRDGGTTWSGCNAGLPRTQYDSNIVEPVDAIGATREVAAAVVRDVLYASDRTACVWSPVSAPGTGLDGQTDTYQPCQFQATGAGLYLGCLDTEPSRAFRVWRSEDAHTWSSLGEFLGSDLSYSLRTVAGELLVHGADAVYPLAAGDQFWALSGAKWTPLAIVAPPATYIRSLAASSGGWLAGTSTRGVYRLVETASR